MTPPKRLTLDLHSFNSTALFTQNSRTLKGNTKHTSVEMKAYFISILLVTVLNKNVAQENITNVSSNVTTVTSSEPSETFIDGIPGPVEFPSSSPTQESKFNETETFGTEIADPTWLPEDEATQSPGSLQPPQLGCRSIGIRTLYDCIIACQGSTSAVQYQISILFNSTGLIKKTFRGFQCQCLQAVPPVDCICHYFFPTCRDAGIANCRLEAFPVTYKDELYDKKMNYTSIPNVSTDFNKNLTESDANSTAVENVADVTSCATYCRDLGFPETKDDLNDNDYNSLCTHNDLHNWTSCACSVIVSFDGGRSVSMSDGMYVCGDDGFEEGLNFAATTSTSARVLMGRQSLWLGIIGLISRILVGVDL
jgi:hypothetical protein